MDRRAATVLGALVADAASMGTHWIYDPDRIAEIEARLGQIAFVPVDAANYDGVPAYLAHAGRATGMLSQYGECLDLATRVLTAQGLDVVAYQKAFAAHFGAGGTYRGYIDRPTRAALAAIEAEITPTGLDDDQLPALTRLPAVVAYHGAGAAQTRDVIRITNVNPVAEAGGQLVADLIATVLKGSSVRDGLQTVCEQAPEDLRGSLQNALNTDKDAVSYGEITGRACHLPMALPLIWHILAGADTYADAVETNIRVGGDSCGRSIAIGAVMGAAHGLEGNGIPLRWILRTHAAGPVLDRLAAL